MESSEASSKVTTVDGVSGSVVLVLEQETSERIAKEIIVFFIESIIVFVLSQSRN